jgi:hypothetical protein
VAQVTDELKFRVSLEDEVSNAAKRAADSIRALRIELGEVKAGEAKGHGGGQSWLHKLYDSEVIRRSISGITSGIREMGEGFRNMDGQQVLRGATEGAAGLAEGLDAVNPILGESVAGVIKLAGSVAGLTVEVATFALEVTNTNDRIRATFGALGGAGAGNEMLGMLNELSTRLPQSREQLADWSKEIEALGITNIDSVRAQVVALASAQAIMGDSGAQAYMKLTEKIRLAEEGTGRLKLSERKLESVFRAGADVSDVARRMNLSVLQLQRRLEAGTINARDFGEALESSLMDRGQAPLEVMMRSLDAMKRKGMETFAHLFDDIDTKPLTDAILSVIDLGDQGEPSGQALKDGITSGVNGIIKEFAHLVTQGEILFLKLELGWIKTGMSIQTIETDVKDLAQAAETAAKPFIAMFDAAKWVFDKGVNAIGKIAFDEEDQRLNVEAQDRAAVAKHPELAGRLPGHATGGIVERIDSRGMAIVRPATGEGLASIGPGEQIVPRDYRQVRPFNTGAMMQMAAPANDGGSARSLHIGQIVVQAPGGITHAQDVTVTGLTLALERMQLASGR